MSLLSNSINVFCNRFVRHRIRRHYRELGGRPFSLLSNNCLAGLVYHDLGLRFDSPTINCCMAFPAFVEFVERLDHALTADLTEEKSAARPYPVGRLRLADKTWLTEDTGRDLLIHFVHYSDFDSAVNAWKKRAARVDRSRVVLLAAENTSCSEANLLRFQALPFPKLLLTPSARTADILGEDAFLFANLPADAFRITDFSGLAGRRFYHRIGVAETMFRLAERFDRRAKSSRPFSQNPAKRNHDEHGTISNSNCAGAVEKGPTPP